MDPTEAVEFSKILSLARAEGKITDEEYVKRTRALYDSAARHGEINARDTIQRPVDSRTEFQDLAEILTERQLAVSAPWRLEMANYQASYKALFEVAKTADATSLQNEVREKALAQELSPCEALCLQYLLFFEGTAEEACRMLALILLRTPPSRRSKLHNWGSIAAHMDPGDLNIHGAEIVPLTCPLFPPKTCRVANDKIFAAHNVPLFGGGGAPPKKGSAMSLFRTEEGEESFPINGGKEPFENGYHRSVSVSTATDAKIDELRAQVASLQSSLAALAPSLHPKRVEAKGLHQGKASFQGQEPPRPRFWGGDALREQGSKN